MEVKVGGEEEVRIPEMTWRGIWGNFHSHVSALTHLPLEVQSSISGNPKIITIYRININRMMVKVNNMTRILPY